MRKLNILMMSLGFILLVGCVKLEHLDELLTLKDLSQEGDAQDRYAQEQDHKFELLVEAIKSKTLKAHSHKNKIIKIFGEPIFAEKMIQDGQETQKWLYRYMKKFFDSEKVYLYFDHEEKLIHWEYIPAREDKSDGTVSAETKT